MTKQIDGDPMCGEHRIRLAERMDGFSFKTSLYCPVCDKSSSMFWHNNMAIKYASKNEKKAARHREVADLLDKQIKELLNTK